MATKRLLVTPLDAPQFEAMDYSSEVTGIPKTELVRRGLAMYLWIEHSILWPGYQPDECPYCDAPMTSHILISPGTDEPGHYQCPPKIEEIPY